MNDFEYAVRYQFDSYLDDETPLHFLQTFFVEIYEKQHEPPTEKHIGRVTLKLINATAALNKNYSLGEVYDVEEYTFRIGERIMNFEEDDFNQNIHEFYNYEIIMNDLCIIQDLEIIASHRGLGLGKKIVKDIYDNFSAKCSLIVVQTFPTQFDINTKRDHSSWKESLQLDQLSNDHEKAHYKLKAFYQDCGFNHIDGYEDLMFMNTTLINEKLFA